MSKQLYILFFFLLFISASNGCQKDKVDELIRDLESEHKDVRVKAITELSKIDEPRVINSLIEALKNDDSDIRKSAANTLAGFKDYRSVNPLIEALNDQDNNVRRSAAHALGQIRDSRAVKPLIAALKDTKPDVRSSAAIALGEIQDEQAVKPLIAGLYDDDENVRKSVAIALQKINNPMAIGLLIEALKRSSWNRSDVVKALQMITGKTFDDNPERWQHWYERTIDYVYSGRELERSSYDWITSYYGPDYFFADRRTLAVDFVAGARALAVDLEGNVYVTGGCRSKTHNNDFCTIKYNSEGVEQWVTRYSSGAERSFDEPTAITTDASGNVYVTGISWNYGKDKSDAYVTIKYDNAGIEKWAVRYETKAFLLHHEETGSIVVDHAGNVYVRAKNKIGSRSSACIIIKYSNAGLKQWEVHYKRSKDSIDEAASIAVDKSGNVYMIGTSFATWSSTANTDYGIDYFTIKYSNTGIRQWVAYYNGPGKPYLGEGATDLAVDNRGNVYVTGYSYGSGNDSDYATIKYNFQGKEQWVVRYNGPKDLDDFAYSIKLDDNGNVYVTGGYDGSSGVGGISVSYYGEGYATIKYDNNGVLQWIRNYKPERQRDYCRATDLALDNKSNVYVTGICIFYPPPWGYFRHEVYNVTFKYNSDGAYLWELGSESPITSRKPGGKPTISIVTDIFGNAHLIGNLAN